jgi:uncharacterized membrane protein HdeD (DUF308 family)
VAENRLDDAVDRTSADSFPASDPPGWIGTIAGGPARPVEDRSWNAMSKTGWLSAPLSQQWRMAAVQGVAAIVLGLLAVLWPAIALVGLVLIFAVYCIIHAIFPLREAIAKARHGGHWIMPGFRALFWLIAAAIATIAGTMAAIFLGFEFAFRPTPAVVAMTWLIAIGAFACGGLLLMRAIRLHRDWQKRVVSGQAARLAP